MIRNPKDFGVWSACPSGVHSVITELEMLPFLSHPDRHLISPEGRETCSDKRRQEDTCRDQLG